MQSDHQVSLARGFDSDLCTPRAWADLDELVAVDDGDHVHVLALVLVDALDLHVVHGVHGDGDARPLLDLRRQSLLVVVLDGGPLAAECLVLCKGLQALRAPDQGLGLNAP